MPYFDDSDRSDGAVVGGVQVFWRAEAATVTATQPKLEIFDLRLQDLMGLSYVTGRLLQDAVALGPFLANSFATGFAFKIDDGMLNGTGVGQLQGVLTAGNGARITVTKESGQATASLDIENVRKILNRTSPMSRTNGVFVMNLDLEPQLWGMTQVVGTGGVPVYMPAGGVSVAPFGTLFGRPIMISEHAPAAGTAGDISFQDFSQYMVIDKGGVQAAESMHVRFIYDEQTFRFIQRINGAPIWRTPKTRHKGTNTVSPHVMLGARA